jgi:hypothetical protein
MSHLQLIPVKVKFNIKILRDKRKLAETMTGLGSHKIEL